MFLKEYNIYLQEFLATRNRNSQLSKYSAQIAVLAITPKARLSKAVGLLLVGGAVVGGLCDRHRFLYLFLDFDFVLSADGQAVGVFVDVDQYHVAGRDFAGEDGVG